MMIKKKHIRRSYVMFDDFRGRRRLFNKIQMQRSSFHSRGGHVFVGMFGQFNPLKLLQIYTAPIYVGCKSRKEIIQPT